MYIERRSESRWLVGIEGLAVYLGCTIRQARDLRAKGLPARKVAGGRRLYFSIAKVDHFIESEGSL